MILDAVRESKGRAMAADEDRLLHWMRLASSREGISLCPETAACLDVLETALAQGFVDRDETVVVFNTGAAQKYVEAMEVTLAHLDAVHGGAERFVREKAGVGEREIAALREWLIE